MKSAQESFHHKGTSNFNQEMCSNRNRDYNATTSLKMFLGSLGNNEHLEML